MISADVQASGRQRAALALRLHSTVFGFTGCHYNGSVHANQSLRDFT